MKIAILEDEEDFGKNLKKHFEHNNYEAYLLFDLPNKIFERLNEVVEFSPDKITIDGLGGLCIEIHEKLAKELPKAKIVIYSSNDEVRDKAKEKGYVFFDKSYTERDKFFEYMRQ